MSSMAISTVTGKRCPSSRRSGNANGVCCNCNDNFPAKRSRKSGELSSSSSRSLVQQKSNAACQSVPMNIPASSSLTPILSASSSSSSSSPTLPSFKIPLDDLCGGIIQAIYSMLDDPRDIYNLSHCSKYLLDLVTYDCVIRAAMFHSLTYVRKRGGGQLRLRGRGVMGIRSQRRDSVKRTLLAVKDSLNANLVYVPSPQRLLRLVNGMRCEMGKNCWMYNHATHKTPVVRFIQNDACLFICKECNQHLFTTMKEESPTMATHRYLKGMNDNNVNVHSNETTTNVWRRDTSVDFSSRVQSGPLVEESVICTHPSAAVTSSTVALVTGSCATTSSTSVTNIGHYTTYRDLRQLTHSFPDYVHKRFHQVCNQHGHHQQQQQQYSSITTGSPEMFQGMYDIFKSHNVERIRTDPHSKFRTRILNIIQKAKEDGIKHERKMKAKLALERVERLIKKQMKMKVIHRRISESIGDDRPWKDVALDCAWNPCPNSIVNTGTGNNSSSAAAGNDAILSNSYCDFEVVTYSCPFVRDLLAKFIRSPSSATNKDIHQIAREITSAFDALHYSSFFTYSFLSRECPCENALRGYAEQHLALANNALPMIVKRARKYFFQAVKEGDYGNALAAIFYYDGYAGGKMFCTAMHHHGSDIALEVDGHEYFSQMDWLKFLLSLWVDNDCYYIYEDDESNRMTGIKERYTKVTIKFQVHHVYINSYLNDDRTKAFLEGQEGTFGNTYLEDPGHGLSRAEVVRRSLIYNTELLHLSLTHEELLDSHILDYLSPGPPLLNFLL